MMGLSCDCGYEPSAGDVIYSEPSDFKELNTKAPRKCCSCNKKLLPGDTVVEFARYKVPDCEYEYNRFGEDFEDGPKRASYWMCEECGELFFSLSEIGFCVSPKENQRELLKEYHEHVETYNALRKLEKADD